MLNLLITMIEGPDTINRFCGKTTKLLDIIYPYKYYFLVLSTYLDALVSFDTLIMLPWTIYGLPIFKKEERGGGL